MNDPSNPDDTDPASRPGDAATGEGGLRGWANARHEAELTKREAMRGGWSMIGPYVVIQLINAACKVFVALGSSLVVGVATVVWRTWGGG